MTRTTRRIHTLLIALVALTLVVAFPGTASADNPWIGPWVTVIDPVDADEELGEAFCNVKWKLSGKTYGDTISCTVWDEEDDGLAVGLSLTYFANGKWVAIGSCWNTSGEDSKKTCTFKLAKAPLNYTLRMVMTVKKGSKVLASPTATVEAKNVPNRR